MGQLVISVIIPVYNAENYIVECARSLLGQTYRNIEFIFIDDCSTDSSFKKLEMVVGEYPGLNVRIVRHSENKGAAASRNDGLSLATGDYIGFVDADDWIEPEMYERMCREIRLMWLCAVTIVTMQIERRKLCLSQLRRKGGKQS